MDRARPSRPFDFESMPSAKGGPLKCVLHAEHERVRNELGAHARARRALPQTSVLRVAADDNVAEGGRASRQPKTHCAPHARNGIASDHAGAAHEQAPSGTQNIPVFIAWNGDWLLRRSVEFRHHLHPDGAGIHVSGGRDGLVQPLCDRLGFVQHAGGGLLRSHTAQSIGKWSALHFQHRPGQSIHQRSLDENTAGFGRENQHGRAWALLRQHLYRTTLAHREIRRHLPEIIRRRTRFIPWLVGVLSLLQSRTTTHQFGQSDARAILRGKLREAGKIRKFLAPLRSGLALRAVRLRRTRPTLHGAKNHIPAQPLPSKKGGVRMDVADNHSLLY